MTLGRGALLALSAACLAACATPPTPAPFLRAPDDIRPVQKTFYENILSRKTVGGLTLRIYNTGSIRTRGSVASSLKSWDARVRLDVPVFLIRHPRGYVLFDTGISTSTAERLNQVSRGYPFKFQSVPGRDIVSQLRGDGIDPGAVRWIVLSHLHWDHAGLADLFPAASVIVSGREWADEKRRIEKGEPDAVFDPAFYEGGGRMLPVDLSTEPAFGAFEHGKDLLSDGSMYLVDLKGHTLGSAGLWVNLGGGPVLLAGDAAWVIDNYMDLAMPARDTMQIMDDYWRTLFRMRAMQEAVPNLVILPGHDLAARAITTRTDLPLVPFFSGRP